MQVILLIYLTVALVIISSSNLKNEGFPEHVSVFSFSIGHYLLHMDCYQQLPHHGNFLDMVSSNYLASLMTKSLHLMDVSQVSYFKGGYHVFLAMDVLVFAFHCHIQVRQTIEKVSAL